MALTELRTRVTNAIRILRGLAPPPIPPVDSTQFRRDLQRELNEIDWKAERGK